MKSQIIKPLTPFKATGNVSVFLAGTIDNGEGSIWYPKITDQFKSYVDFYVPRRDDWNPNADDSYLKDQIEWELSAIGDSDVVCFYFEDNSKSPITLLELGLCLASKKTVLVYCTDKFYRYQNVLTTCEMYGVNLFSTVDELNNELRKIVVSYPVR